MSDAEQLVEIADDVMYPRNEVLLIEGLPPCAADTVALAIRLRKRPDVVLRAMVEEWTRFQIVRELY